MNDLENIYAFYRGIMNDKKEQKGTVEDKTSQNENTEKLFDDVNNEISKNEKQKRKFKKIILNIVITFTFIQLVFFNLIVFFVIISLTLNKECFVHLDVNMTSEVLSFLKYYIGATVVELLGMLLFIIKYVFSDTKKLTKE